jgi:hypothetical protein
MYSDVKREENLKKGQGRISGLRGQDFRQILKVGACPFMIRRNLTFQSFSNGALIHFEIDKYFTTIPPRGKPT